MKKISLAELNTIPEFLHKGRLCIEIEGKIYSKQGIINFLFAAGLLAA